MIYRSQMLPSYFFDIYRHAAEKGATMKTLGLSLIAAVSLFLFISACLPVDIRSGSSPAVKMQGDIHCFIEAMHP